MHGFKDYFGKSYSSEELEKSGAWRSSLGYYVLGFPGRDLIFEENGGEWIIAEACRNSIDLEKENELNKIVEERMRRLIEHTFYIQKEENIRRYLERESGLKPGSLIYNRTNSD